MSSTLRVLRLLGVVAIVAAFLPLLPPGPVQTPRTVHAFGAAPIACWAAEGNGNDAIGATNVALSGGAAFASGRIGQAFSFNGATAYASANLPAALRKSPITLAAWVNLNSTSTSTHALFLEPSGANQLGKGAGLQLYAGGGVGFTKGSGDGSYAQIVAATPITAGGWHHIAGSYDGAAMAVYVDGVLGASVANTQGIDWTDQAGGFPTPAQLYLGAYKTNQLGPGATAPDQGFLNGRLDEVQIFDRALTVEEIAALAALAGNATCGTAAPTATPPGSVPPAPAATPTSTAGPLLTPTPTRTDTPSPASTATSTPGPLLTPTQTATATPAPKDTPSPAETPTVSPTVTPTETPKGKSRAEEIVGDYLVKYNFGGDTGRCNHAPGYNFSPGGHRTITTRGDNVFMPLITGDLGATGPLLEDGSFTATTSYAYSQGTVTATYRATVATTGEITGTYVVDNGFCITTYNILFKPATEVVKVNVLKEVELDCETEVRIIAEWRQPLGYGRNTPRIVSPSGQVTDLPVVDLHPYTSPYNSYRWDEGAVWTPKEPGIYHATVKYLPVKTLTDDVRPEFRVRQGLPKRESMETLRAAEAAKWGEITRLFEAIKTRIETSPTSAREIDDQLSDAFEGAYRAGRGLILDALLGLEGAYAAQDTGAMRERLRVMTSDVNTHMDLPLWEPWKPLTPTSAGYYFTGMREPETNFYFTPGQGDPLAGPPDPDLSGPDNPGIRNPLFLLWWDIEPLHEALFDMEQLRHREMDVMDHPGSSAPPGPAWASPEQLLNRPISHLCLPRLQELKDDLWAEVARRMKKLGLTFFGSEGQGVGVHFVSDYFDRALAGLAHRNPRETRLGLTDVWAIGGVIDTGVLRFIGGTIQADFLPYLYRIDEIEQRIRQEQFRLSDVAYIATPLRIEGDFTRLARLRRDLFDQRDEIWTRIAEHSHAMAKRLIRGDLLDGEYGPGVPLPDGQVGYLDALERQAAVAMDDALTQMERETLPTEVESVVDGQVRHFPLGVIFSESREYLFEEGPELHRLLREKLPEIEEQIRFHAQF